ncbi:uncharacterized protein (UPF0276 family) [Paraburkholderia sp. WSM4175]|uniref:multinuclear nonheme iron-dependent oxidase n=1 Tax=Paraburkholderia sp. WSM4175 TaxID=2991072 RepID=UPI003D20C33A
MRQLGVGLVYWPELAPLFDDNKILNVLEVEPQAFWELVGGQDGYHYRINDTIISQIELLPQDKLIHGIGQPVGGTVDDPIEYFAQLRRVVRRLDPAWVSEHLSFNRTRVSERCEESGFLLPPRQSAAGVSTAVSNIRRFCQQVGRPFAFETGVSYVRPRSDEIEDGAFIAAIAARARCGILLDLHNLWCNQLNGRQPVLDVLEHLPVDRVWELHLAGGMEYQGFWLDGHNDAIPAQLLQLAEQVVPQLSNLAAIIFEILPEHVGRIGIDKVYKQLETLHALWKLRPPQKIVAARSNVNGVAHRVTRQGSITGDPSTEVCAWELSLVAALRGGEIFDHRFADLQDDPGVAVLRQLISDARRASIARALRYSSILLLLGVGPGETHALLNEYFCIHAPTSFASLEADRFATFLRSRASLCAAVPYLLETLAFEQALVRATTYGVTTDLVWTIDPTALFASLDKGCAPTGLKEVTNAMRVSPGMPADSSSEVGGWTPMEK